MDTVDPARFLFAFTFVLGLIGLPQQPGSLRQQLEEHRVRPPCPSKEPCKLVESNASRVGPLGVEVMGHDGGAIGTREAITGVVKNERVLGVEMGDEVSQSIENRCSRGAGSRELNYVVGGDPAMLPKDLAEPPGILVGHIEVGNAVLLLSNSDRKDQSLGQLRLVGPKRLPTIGTRNNPGLWAAITFLPRRSMNWKCGKQTLLIRSVSTRN